MAKRRSDAVLAIGLMAMLAGRPLGARAVEVSAGTLVEAQVDAYGPFAYHLDAFRTLQALARSGDRLVAAGATSGGLCDDRYEQGRIYRIQADGTLAFERPLPVNARAIAVRGTTAQAVAFDAPEAPLGDDCGPNSPGATNRTTTHLTLFTLDAQGTVAVTREQKPPTEYTRALRWLIPVAQGTIVVERAGLANRGPDRVLLISPEGDRVLARHTEPLPSKGDAVLSLSAEGALAAVALSGGRVKLLSLDAGLAVSAEWRVNGVRHVALAGTTLHTYASDGTLRAFDVTAPGSPRPLWTRRIAPVPDSTGLVVDGGRLLVSGLGLAEVPADGSAPGTFFRPTGHWTKLASIVPAGETIYAFNGGGSTSKVLVLRLVR